MPLAIFVWPGGFWAKIALCLFFFFSRPRKLFSRPGLRSVVTSILRKNAGLTTRNNPKVKQFMFAQPNQKENVIWQLLKKKHLEKLSVTLIMKRLVEYYISISITRYWGSAVWQTNNLPIRGKCCFSELPLFEIISF